jgi:UDP-N-acetyl-D-mannosaminuronic acid dehydrogenase
MKTENREKTWDTSSSSRLSSSTEDLVEQPIIFSDGADIHQKQTSVAVIGCGWMGLPTACLFAEKGINVFGIDIQQKIVDMMENGICPYNEPGLSELLERNVKNGHLHFSTDYGPAVALSKFVIIIVPTGIDQNKKSDYSSLEKACQKVGELLSRNKIVIIESTLAPSQVNKSKDILEKFSHLKAGEDFSMIYSPIRASAGTVLRDLVNYPKVIGGIDQRSLDFAEDLFSIIVEGQIIRASSMMTAAAAKLFENVYRDVNIALANQLAQYCEESLIDFNEVRRISNTIPSHCQLRGVGAGVGGHCIPVNPYFLINDAVDMHIDLSMVKTARTTNDSMPSYVASEVEEALQLQNRSLSGSKIIILGAAFKSNVPELRYSPSIQIQNNLSARGANVLTYDPLCSQDSLSTFGYRLVDNLESALNGADCLVIAVGHDVFRTIDYQRLVGLMRTPFVFDCCGVIQPSDAKKWNVFFKALGNGALK